MQGGKYVGFGSAGSAPPRPPQGATIDQVTNMLSTGWNQLSSVAGAQAHVSVENPLPSIHVSIRVESITSGQCPMPWVPYTLMVKEQVIQMRKRLVRNLEDC